MDPFKPLLKHLVDAPESFTLDDLHKALQLLFRQDHPHPAQIGAFLTALHVTRLEQKPGVLATAVSVLLQTAMKADVLDPDGHFIVDIVGTGGDGHNTFNVSTTAAVVAAGAGARVIKVRPHAALI
jgi:anthranilate phosphoribosyltransferase